jgi:cytochrome P450
MDLFAAGSETTSTTLRWALLFMVLNPKVQVITMANVYQRIG